MNKISQSNMLIIGMFCLGTSLLFAGGNSDGTISWGFLTISLFGGLSLFLYGMAKMSEGMKKAAGNKMRNILAVLTKNRVIALIVGAFVTMVIQSSSATTVMLVSFVQAELMTYAQSIGIILGANIGTTVTAQLVAFKLTDYALLMITVGFAMTMFGKKESVKHIGEAILGFGILFFGMKIMSDAMKPLRSFQPFIDLMKGLENPLFGILIGAAFTALIQSSSAFTGIVIVLAQQGLLTLEAGIPLILGANIGTCITAALASIGTIREAKRVAIAHVLFNIGGVLIFVWLIPPLAELVRSLSTSSGLEGMDKLAAETPRQIANAHTIFNVSVGLIFLPFTAVLATQVYRILPKRDKVKGIEPAIWHIDDSQIFHPAVAIKLAQTEMSRMLKILGRMLDACFYPFNGEEEKQDEIYPQLSLIEGIDMREEKIDFIEEHITNYLFQISRGELNDLQAEEVFAMVSMTDDLESIGDVIHRNIVPLIYKKQALKESFSSEGEKELVEFHIKTMKQVSRLTDAFSELNFDMAQKVIKKELKYQSLGEEYKQAHLKRVQKETTESVATHEVHMELMDMLKQINVYLANIAKTISDAEKL
ncbi:MAG: Na/Pi cotransporter family protein [Candidatus Marinimicrobia bacterium]|nr:Na/Pi cotransporter family protein [Candidatus Neomarinimicrobiota bacterium]MBT3618733.1 Na/Pi cotransporter family protein [Candidatus Neomarinimicrobiota bacterium]MBT3828300.1 Na/Pi cotransporter family protein [Candidatus Neomarinimicrobiota bacterium]MBT3997239.1 Na/Pi cotransporter family protein [Candidatus Neomarinimicrobiota bacterium]MBT4280163.1 Na/Pi cotransporter family protein [Candidatus Neomarinimicrobiota bacterium]